MKISITVFLSILLILSTACSSEPEVRVSLETSSGSDVISTEITASEMKNGAQLLSISFTNKGTKTAYIKNIRIDLSSLVAIDSLSSFLYGGHDMGRTPIQIRKYNEKQLFSGAFLVVKNGNTDFSKIGLLSWNIFRPYISFSKEDGIMMNANGENKPIAPGETLAFEKIVVEKSDCWQDILFSYGEQVAEIQEIQTREIIQFKGWSTWDYYGRDYNDHNIYENVDQLELSGIEANLIQIDGGWWTARGDYLSVKEDLPDGMKAIADYIKSKGYLPGIHLDGFRADKASEIYKKHPDWFLTDQNGETICQVKQKGNDFMQYIYFDYSNPDVCKYMKDILTTIREDWGFRYFKIDFMRYGSNDDILNIHAKEGVTEIHAADPSMTSMERTRAGLRAMREGIGDAFFLGCSSVFGPTFGLVDGLRTGGDISPVMEFYRTRCLQNGGNFFLNKSVVQNDADYLVLRNKFDEDPTVTRGTYKFGGTTSLTEAKMWADYAALFGGIRISSDNLVLLREERKELIRNAFSYTSCDRFLPLDLWDHASDNDDAFNVMLGENKDGLYLVLFNWDEQPLEISLSGLPGQISSIVDEKNKSLENLKDGEMAVTLEGHSSLILEIRGEVSFDQCRKSIKPTLRAK